MNKTAKPRIGFIGLGKMGWPMARRLAEAGYELHVADADQQRTARFLTENGRAKLTAPGTLKELATVADIAIAILPDGKVVRDVLCGRTSDGGGDCLLAGFRPGSLMIDMSSSSPIGTRALGERLAAHGVQFIDAPVSGGVKRAIDGSLAIMVGGDPAFLERARPILEALGRQIFPTGPLGSGHAMKALNNYVSAAGLVAAAEALRIGQRFGLAADTMVDILNASTGRNNSTENKFKPFILPRNFASGFSLGLMAKDLRTALEVAAATATPSPLGVRCVELWTEAEAKLGSNADHTEIVRYLESLG